MKQEYLPILEERQGKLLITGEIERLQAHSNPPVPHATALIVAVLPDGRIILADKADKQRRKGKKLPAGRKVLDCFGGHMRYDSIPVQEYTQGLSMETFRKCAVRELSEELVRLDENGHRQSFIPEKELLAPIGMYTLKNDHNWEYTWAFVYFLQDYGPYTSEDTLMKADGEEIIKQDVYAVTWEELLDIYDNGANGEKVIWDGIGRILGKDKGEMLYKCIKNAGR